MADIQNMPSSQASSQLSNSFDKFVGSTGSGLSVANSAAGLIDSIFGFSARRQQKMQKELMSQSQDYWKEQQDILAQQQLDQWNRENEYNDPTNYYKRLMAGAQANGITKQAALMGEQPGSVGTAAHDSQPAAGSGVSAPGGSSLLPIGSAASLSNLRQRAEISNLESLSNLYDKESGLTDARTTTEQLEWSVRDSVFRLNNALSGQASSQASLNKVLTDIQKINKKYAEDTNLASINNLNAQAASCFAAVKELVSRADLNDARRNEIKYEIQQIMSEVALNAAYRNLVAANAGISQAELKVIDRNFSQFAAALKASWSAQETASNIAGFTEQRMSWDLDNYSIDKALSQFESFMNSLGVALSFGTSLMGIFMKDDDSKRRSADRNRPRTREVYDGSGTLRRVERSR